MRASGTYSPEAAAKITGEMGIEEAEMLTKLKSALTQSALSQYYGMREGGGQPQMPDIASTGMAALSAYQTAQESPIDEYYKRKLEQQKARAPFGLPYDALIA